MPRPRATARLSGRALLPPLLLVLLAASLAGCTDYAVRLSAQVARSARLLEDQPDGSLAELPWRPGRRGGPYRVLFLPAGRLSAAELEAAGLPPAEAARMVEDLAAFTELGRGLVVVAREGERIAFSSHWTSYAAVDEILVGELKSPTAYPAVVRLVKREERVVVEAVR